MLRQKSKVEGQMTFDYQPSTYDIKKATLKGRFFDVPM